MRILIVGDSPLINTGFGRVNGIAARTFQEHGWDVAAVAGLTEEKPLDDKGIKIYVPKGGRASGDPMGVRMFGEAIGDFNPDAVYMTGDTGSATAFSFALPDLPGFAYMPIEGSPLLNRHWQNVIKGLPFMTCSKYGADSVEDQFGFRPDFAYHGIDPEVFKVTGTRDIVRRAMKWDGKFVIMCVSTNVRRKQLPRLIEAFSILKHQYKQKDAILYLHTVPYQDHWLDGWNLMDINKMFDVEHDVFFHPKMGGFGSSVPEFTGDPKNPGLVDFYNAADLFVLPSQVEGFGLPIAEAMACGLPVLVTKYAAGWEVASPAGRGIPVDDWEVHKSGTVYANASVRKMAEEMLRLIRDPKGRQRMSEAGLRRSQDFRWDDFITKLIPAMEQTIVTHQERDRAKQEQDKAEETPGQEVDDLRQQQGEDPLQEVSGRPQGQSQDTVGQETQDGSLAAEEA